MNLPDQTFALFWLAFIGIGLLMLIWWHTRHDNFDLRDSITSPGTDGVRRVDTAKSLLVSAFIVSAYWVTENYSDTALGIFLGAWVINGGVVVLQKVFKPAEVKP